MGGTGRIGQQFLCCLTRNPGERTHNHMLATTRPSLTATTRSNETMKRPADDEDKGDRRDGPKRSRTGQKGRQDPRPGGYRRDNRNERNRVGQATQREWARRQGGGTRGRGNGRGGGRGRGRGDSQQHPRDPVTPADWRKELLQCNKDLRTATGITRTRLIKYFKAGGTQEDVEDAAYQRTFDDAWAQHSRNFDRVKNAPDLAYCIGMALNDGLSNEQHRRRPLPRTPPTNPLPNIPEGPDSVPIPPSPTFSPKSPDMNASPIDTTAQSPTISPKTPNNGDSPTNGADQEMHELELQTNNRSLSPLSKSCGPATPDQPGSSSEDHSEQTRIDTEHGYLPEKYTFVASGRDKRKPCLQHAALAEKREADRRKNAIGNANAAISDLQAAVKTISEEEITIANALSSATADSERKQARYADLEAEATNIRETLCSVTQEMSDIKAQVVAHNSQRNELKKNQLKMAGQKDKYSRGILENQIRKTTLESKAQTYQPQYDKVLLETAQETRDLMDSVVAFHWLADDVINNKVAGHTSMKQRQHIAFYLERESLELINNTPRRPAINHPFLHAITTLRKQFLSTWVAITAQPHDDATETMERVNWSVLTILWQEDEVARYDRTWHITEEQANTHVWPIPRPEGEKPTDFIDLSQISGRELLPRETKTTLDPRIGRFHPTLYEHFGERCEAFKHNNVAATLWNYTRYHQPGRPTPKETKDALDELEANLGDQYADYAHLFPPCEEKQPAYGMTPNDTAGTSAEQGVVGDGDGAGAAAAAKEEAPADTHDNKNAARPAPESAKSDGEPDCQAEPRGTTTAAEEGGAPKGIADNNSSGKAMETDEKTRRTAHDAAENTDVDVSEEPKGVGGDGGGHDAGLSAQDGNSSNEGTGAQTSGASDTGSCEVAKE